MIYFQLIEYFTSWIPTLDIHLMFNNTQLAVATIDVSALLGKIDLNRLLGGNKIEYEGLVPFTPTSSKPAANRNRSETGADTPSFGFALELEYVDRAANLGMSREKSAKIAGPRESSVKKSANPVDSTVDTTKDTEVTAASGFSVTESSVQESTMDHIQISVKTRPKTVPPVIDLLDDEDDGDKDGDVEMVEPREKFASARGEESVTASRSVEEEYTVWKRTLENSVSELEEWKVRQKSKFHSQVGPRSFTFMYYYVF